MVLFVLVPFVTIIQFKRGSSSKRLWKEGVNMALPQL